MVVVLVVWAKTGAPQPAREAAGQWVRAGLLLMQLIVAPSISGAGMHGLEKRCFAAKKCQSKALTTASPIATVPTLVVPSL